METKETKTRNELKEIWDGLNYHMRELSSFMIEHSEDDFFNTTLGKKMRILTAEMSLAHVSGMISLMSKPEIQECEDEKEKPSGGLEDLLKSMIESV